jgi:hypothetical protein
MVVDKLSYEVFSVRNNQVVRSCIVFFQEYTMEVVLIT